MCYTTTLVLILLTAALAAAAPQTLIDTDFAESTVATKDVKDPLHSITGSIPAGWLENSGWNKEIVVTYQPTEEAGRRFLRVTKSSGGTSQLAVYLDNIPQETFYRLELTARSASKAGVTVGLRDQGPPYTFHWSAPPSLTGEWQDLTYDFRVDPKTEKVGFWVNLSDDGSYDLAHLKLTARGREDMIEELKAKYPESGPKNLVRVSRFPLGLPTGWSLDRDCSDDEVIVTGDSATRGPSDAPAMSIKSGIKWRLWTAPVFIGRSFEPHTASIYARGSGKLRLTAFGDGRQLQSAEQELKSGEWQRVSLTFTPVLLGQMHQVAIDGSGNVSLDAFQIEHGSTATEYAPQQQCEIALALPESSASAARIQFTDEPAEVMYAVTGAPAGAVLKLRQASLYGDQVDSQRTPAAAPATIKLTIPGNHPLGPFRVEAHVENAQGLAISPTDEVVVYRLRRPRYWNKPAPNSPFGVHTNSTTRHILMAKAIGANWTRLHDAGTPYIGWAHLEPEPGQWTFHDTELKRYVDHGLKILGLLSTAPLWATVQDKPHNGYFDRYVEPKDFNQFANYVKVVTERYKGLIDSYDVWNEPWGTSFWSMGWDEEKKDFKRSPTASEDYYRLQKTTFDAAHGVDPKLTILGFNTYGGEVGRDWSADLAKFGALEACDAVCYHHYTSAYCGYPDDDVTKALDLAVSPIIKAKGRVGKAIWMTEGSPNTYQLNNGFYHHTEPGQPQDNNWDIGNRLCRYVVSLLANGVSKTFIYTMHGHGQFRPKPWEWTVLVEDDGYLHPSGAAYAHMTWLLEDTKFAKHLEPKPGVFAYLFEGQGRAVAVLSTKPEHAAYKLPSAQGLQATDLFGNPVRPGTEVGDNLVYLAADKLTELQNALRGR